MCGLRLPIEDAGVQFFVVGRFEVLERPHPVSFSWRCSPWLDASIERLVTVSLAHQGHGETLMTIDHTLFRPNWSSSTVGDGRSSSDQLNGALSRLPEGR